MFAHKLIITLQFIASLNLSVSKEESPRKCALYFKKVTLGCISDSLQSINNPNKSPLIYNYKMNTNPIIFRSFISK